MLDGAEVVCLEKIDGPPGGGQVPLPVGGRLPATCTALGKAILAFADREVWDTVVARPLARLTPYSIVTTHVLSDEMLKVKAQGVAFEHEETRLGVTCVAAPIFQDSRAIAAVSVGARTDESQLPRRVDAVRAAAATITARLRLPA
jgi:DNA-binding IclR family transcriptional regulator